MAKIKFKVEAVSSQLSTLPNVNGEGYVEGVSHQVNLAFNDPDLKGIVLDGSIAFVMFNEEQVKDFTIGKEYIVEIVPA